MFSTLLSNFNLLSKIIPRYLYFSTLSTISPSIVIGETAGGCFLKSISNSFVYILFVYFALDFFIVIIYKCCLFPCFVFWLLPLLIYFNHSFASCTVLFSHLVVFMLRMFLFLKVLCVLWRNNTYK